MNISCTRCSPDLLGASLSDCQSVCLDISWNICLSVTRLLLRPSARVDRNWELLGVSPSSRRRRDGTRSHPGGGPAPTVDLDRLVRLVCRHSCRAADHHLALTCPAPSIGAPSPGATQQVTPHLMPELTPRLFRSTPVSATMSSKWEPKVGQGTAKHRFEKTPNESCFEVKM